MNKVGLVRFGGAVAAALILSVAFALPANAQDAPHEGTLVVDPENVPEAGEYTVTITGSDWFAGEALLLSTCVAPIDDPLVPGVSGPAEIGAAIEAWAADPFTFCKVSEAVTVTPDADGNFTQELEIDVVDNFFISAVASALDDTQQGTIWYQIVDPDAAAELAVTGVDSGEIALFGVVILLAGGLMVGRSRRTAVAAR